MIRAGYGTEDQIWIRDQTARILHRHILSGKHCRIDLGALLSRVGQIQSAIPVNNDAVPERKAA
jgi:hypothetical protein